MLPTQYLTLNTIKNNISRSFQMTTTVFTKNNNKIDIYYDILPILKSIRIAINVLTTADIFHKFIQHSINIH